MCCLALIALVASVRDYIALAVYAARAIVCARNCQERLPRRVRLFAFTRARTTTMRLMRRGGGTSRRDDDARAPHTHTHCHNDQALSSRHMGKKWHRLGTVSIMSRDRRATHATRTALALDLHAQAGCVCALICTRDHCKRTQRSDSTSSRYVLSTTRQLWMCTQATHTRMHTKQHSR